MDARTCWSVIMAAWNLAPVLPYLQSLYFYAMDNLDARIYVFQNKIEEDDGDDSILVNMTASMGSISSPIVRIRGYTWLRRNFLCYTTDSSSTLTWSPVLTYPDSRTRQNIPSTGMIQEPTCFYSTCYYDTLTDLNFQQASPV